MDRPKPVVLLVLDGWGVAPYSDQNAITLANTPTYDRLISEYPAMTLYASGQEVGLSVDQCGNCEAGHLNIGAGRVCYTDMQRIDKAISDGSFFGNSNLVSAMDHVISRESRLHLIGMISSSHSIASPKHYRALLELAKRKGVAKVYVHAILDGRHSSEKTGLGALSNLRQMIDEVGVGRIASISGSYFALDRDLKWERIKKYYNTITNSSPDKVITDSLEALKFSYQKEIYDENVEPVMAVDEIGEVHNIRSSDAVIFFNHRADFTSQLVQPFVIPTFDKFSIKNIKDIYVSTLVEYQKDLPAHIAFLPPYLNGSFGEIISKNGLKQMNIAETEKYAYITYFLNGATEDIFDGQQCVIVPSPLKAEYTQTPELSIAQVVKKVTKSIDEGKFDFISVNLANADVLGHTGLLDPTIRACEFVDIAIKKIVDHVLARNGLLIVTSDHGNAEDMQLQEEAIRKGHTNNPVPFILVSRELRGQAGPAGDPPEGDLSLAYPSGTLADIAPTILKIMQIKKPSEMSGRELI